MLCEVCKKDIGKRLCINCGRPEIEHDNGPMDTKCPNGNNTYFEYAPVEFYEVDKDAL